MRRISTLVLLALMPTGGVALAAPQHVRISFMNDASTSVGVAWSTLSGAAAAEIKYGTSSGSYPKSATGKLTKISATPGTVSEVTLTGLSPNTTYYYRVGGAAGGWSAEHTLRTAIYPHPQCGAFSFAYMGDSRSLEWPKNKGVSDTWTTVTKQALLRKPRFFLLGGDLIEDGTNEKQWLNYLKFTASASGQLPIMTALGNHEDGPVAGEGAYYNRLMHLPRASKANGGSGTEDYYYFTYGNAIVVSLSTVSFYGGATKFADQAAWLDKVLTAHPKRWRFVMLHHPIYTEKVLGLLGHPPNEKGQNAALVPIFNKHKVDIVFQSHNHWYERFVPSKCAGGSTTPCPASDGTYYITSGGAGAPLSPFAGFINKVRLKAIGAYHYMMMEVAQHKLYVKVYGLAGKLLDSLTLTKTVSSPDPCAAAADGGLAPDSAAADAAPPDTGLDAASSADTGGGAPDLAALDQAAPAADSAASTADSAAPPAPPAADGCSCRVAGPDQGAPWLLWALLALLGLRRRFKC
jgi:MYXO-CTERM domain-containing protein